MFDIMGVQASLLQFRLVNKVYPPSLNALFPAYATPSAGGTPAAQPPLDPVSHEAYTYEVLGSGADYAIAATLSNGGRFAGLPHRPA